MMVEVPTTVLIVDDHAGFRTRARRALELDGFSVVGEAADIAEGLGERARLAPDVVLLDIHLPDGSGLDAAPRFVDGDSATRVVLISTYDEVDVDHAAGWSGIVGFLPKAELSGQSLGRMLAAPTPG